jgi:hypothetical protein
VKRQKVKRVNGFSLIGVLIALTLGMLLLAVASSVVRTIQMHVVSEGTITDGEQIPIAPASEQVPAAMTALHFANEQALSSRWLMCTDKPLDMTLPPSSQSIRSVADADPSAIAKPEVFRTMLQSAGIAISPNSGYAILFFDELTRCSAVLNVEYWDDASNKTRNYRVGFHPSLTSSAIVRYTFAEPIEFTQNAPAATLASNGVLGLTLPDPGARYSLEAGRLQRSISDANRLTAALANLDREEGLCTAISLRP